VPTGSRDCQPARAIQELAGHKDLEVDEDVEAAWSAEIGRRLDRVDAGVAKTIAWSEARRRILAAPAVPRALEFLDEAIEEAEVAARWYAERSPAAAARVR